MANSHFPCRICHNEKGNRLYHVREMMFGFKDEFAYFQCSQCNCLQILQIPSDMSKYYPETYYSFRQIKTKSLENLLKNSVKKLRNRYILFNKGKLVGKLIYSYFPAHDISNYHHYCQITKDTRILDIGCGSGGMLYDFAEAGLNHLLGIDPYLEADITYHNGLRILKKFIHEVEGEWDLIMFHHSFEHIANPEETLCKVSELLHDNGICLIRIPTVSSFAWEHYKENWVQLDAPRHFFLHSVDSVSLLAQKASLKLERIVFDSSSFQFWGSEQYKRDIPLNSERSYGINRQKSIFSKVEIQNFSREAHELNQQHRGDQAAFYLTKK